MLFATHYLEEADQYADRIVLVSQGRVVADGSGVGDPGARRGPDRSGPPGPMPTPTSCAGVAGVESVEVRGESVLVQAHDSDAVARFLLSQTPARDLEITSHGLEDAFLSLTRQTERPGALTCPSQTLDPTTRRVPPLGGFNTTALRIELRRMLRNRRTLIFTLVFPAALFLSFGSTQGWDDEAGNGNVAAYIMVSMALYGAALTAASGGASVAMERSLGWSRQLRLTPLHPAAYILTKVLLALVLGAIAVTVVNLTGLVQGKPSMPLPVWFACGALTLVCTLVFAALGLFVGYLVPGENAMQVLGPGLALLSFLGNVFLPLTEGSTIYRIAEWTPMFGVAEISRWPLTEELSWTAVANAVVWCALFVGGAAWRMSRDTARV